MSEVINNEIEQVTDTDKTTVEKPENKSNETNEKTFTQAELNEIIAKRVERERKKQEELDEKLKRLEALEQAEEERKKAEMSEAERLKAEKEEAAEKAKQALEQAKLAQETANKRIINTEIRSIARSLNANDPNDVLALLDTSSIEIAENGEVKGVEEAVKALKEAKPWMFKQPIGADAVGGGNPTKNLGVSELTLKEKELEELKQQAARNPKLMGKVTKLYNEVIALRNSRK